MPVKSTASCTSVATESYPAGYNSLVMTVDSSTLYFHCSYLDMQDNFDTVIRYQNTNTVPDWTDVSSQSGEGIFLRDTFVDQIVQQNGGNSGSIDGTVTLQGMEAGDFNVLWPLLLGLLVTGAIAKSLRRAL